MAIKEYENGIYTNDLNDPIKKYLLNIIQRYFDIEKNVSNSSKEAIIVQAFTRLKEFMNAYTKNYVIGINEKAGNISLTIRDFGGESKINKRTAFNKDFCTIITDPVIKTLYNNQRESYSNFGNSQADHMVAGNDDRLYDARIPINHIHSIDEIRGLEETLDSLIKNSTYLHRHHNLDVLNKLKYTGSLIELDLILIDELENISKQTEQCLEDTKDYARNTYMEFLYQFHDLLRHITDRISEIRDQLDSWIQSIKNETDTYTNTNINIIDNDIKNYSRKFFTKQEYNDIRSCILNAVKVIDEGSFNIGTNTLLLENDTTVITEDTDSDTKKGYTFINLRDDVSHKITDSSVLSKLDNNINNGKCKLFLEYDKDNNHYNLQLPCFLENNKNDIFYVYNYTDSSNNINVHIDRLTYLPIYLLQSVLSSDILIKDIYDNELNTHFTLSKYDLTYKSNNAVNDETLVEKNTDSTKFTFNNNSNTFEANVFTENNIKKCRLEWSDLGNSYNIAIFRRTQIFQNYSSTYTDWINITQGTSFSSSNSELLSDIYNDGNVYSIYGDTCTLLTGNDKNNAWVDNNGILMSAVNSPNYDILLTKDKYTVYRHKATMTIASINNDNDIISIIISAFKDQNDKLHTLSLLCDKGGIAIDNSVNNNRCFVVVDYKGWVNSSGTVIGSFIHHDPEDASFDNNWLPNQRINFDIRKDEDNIYIYTSGFYNINSNSEIHNPNNNDTLNEYNDDLPYIDIDGDNNYIVININDIKTQTGLDFKEGYIGYGNCSTEKATIVGINFQEYSSYYDTECIDYLTSNETPNIPLITGKCINGTYGFLGSPEETYEINVTPLEKHELFEYKIGIYNPIDTSLIDWSILDPDNSEEINELLYDNALYESDVISVTNFYGHQELDEDNIIFMNNDLITINSVSYDEINNKYTYNITKQVNNANINKIIFCDNTYSDTYENLQEYLSQYSCKICLYSDSIKPYLQFIQHELDPISENEGIPDELLNAFYIDEQNKPNDKYLYFNGDKVESSTEYEKCYYGEYDFNTFRTYFPNAKIRYQLFEIPGKGDNA